MRIDGPRIADGLGFKVTGFDEECITKLELLIAQAPNLSRLTLTSSVHYLPAIFNAISEYQTYPIVFENLMLRFLPSRKEVGPPKAVTRTLEHFFKVYGSHLEVMDDTEFTLQGLEYDGNDIIAATEWLQLEGAVAVDDSSKRIKDLGVIINSLER